MLVLVLLVLLFVDVCCCLLLFVVVCCCLLFLPDPCPRAPKETQYCRARRFLCHICLCTQGFATPWGGVGWGGAVMTFLWT